MAQGQTFGYTTAQSINGHAVVMACVNILYKAATLPLCIYKNKEQDKSHYLNKILKEQPGDGITTGLFWEWCSRSLLL